MINSPQVEVKIGAKEHQFECGEGRICSSEAISRNIDDPIQLHSALWTVPDPCGGRAENLSELVDREVLRLGEEQVEQGFRLSCQTYIREECFRLEVPNRDLIKQRERY